MLLLSGTVISSAAYAAPHHSGDIMVRGGIAGTLVDDGHSTIREDDIVTNTSLTIDDGISVGADFVYFFNRNWAFEAGLTGPFKHDLYLHGVFEDPKFGSVLQATPTLSALFYIDRAWDFKPYVGLGVSYTMFFSEDFAGDAADNLGYENLTFKQSIGAVGQFGADYQVNRNWFVNANVKYVTMSSDVTYTVLTNNRNTTMDINPWIFSFKVGYKF